MSKEELQGLIAAAQERQAEADAEVEDLLAQLTEMEAEADED